MTNGLPAGLAWVGEDTLHRFRRLAGGGKLYVITDGPRRGERAIEHANGRLTILPPDILLSGGYK